MIRLTPVSYIVLGLVGWHGEATPYQLKTTVAGSIGNFWTIQHAQLYSEPERLAAAGLLAETREAEGRKRRTYRLTDEGRSALQAWLASPEGGLGEIRSPGLLQLFFGADPGPLAEAQIAAHEARLATYEELDAIADMPDGPRRALAAGIRLEREWLRFWRETSASRP